MSLRKDVREGCRWGSPEDWSEQETHQGLCVEGKGVRHRQEGRGRSQKAHLMEEGRPEESYLPLYDRGKNALRFRLGWAISWKRWLSFCFLHEVRVKVIRWRGMVWGWSRILPAPWGVTTQHSRATAPKSPEHKAVEKQNKWAMLQLILVNYATYFPFLRTARVKETQLAILII